jgi:ApaG protein
MNTSTLRQELPGLKVILDKLIYHHDPDSLPASRPHGFIYFITIQNLSDRRVTLLGRKWIITRADGNREIVEGDKIVGKTPSLEPGESWSYNSYHVTDQDCRAEGSFQGVDDAGNLIFVRIPSFEMNLPDSGEALGSSFT